jgi:hypothetical protein
VQHPPAISPICRFAFAQPACAVLVPQNKDVWILGDVDAVSQLLEDSLIAMASIAASRYVSGWCSSLTTTQRIIAQDCAACCNVDRVGCFWSWGRHPLLRLSPKVQQDLHFLIENIAAICSHTFLIAFPLPLSMLVSHC